MITKEQYKFLKEFRKLTKQSKKEDKQLAFFNREKVDINKFTELLAKHSELNPAEPFSKKGNDDDLSGAFLVSYINETYLKEIGLYDFIQYFQPDKYGISQQGLQAIDDYKIERLNKIKLPFAAIVIALGSLIVAIIALMLAA